MSGEPPERRPPTGPRHADAQPTDTELAEELRAAIGDFVRRVRVHDRMPPGQAAVLGHLDRNGPLSIADLARCEQVRHQSMTRTVHLLADQDRVRLAGHDRDARQVVVTITADGARALIEERRHRAEAVAHAIRVDLDDADRALLSRIPAVLRQLRTWQ